MAPFRGCCLAVARLLLMAVGIRWMSPGVAAGSAGLEPSLLRGMSTSEIHGVLQELYTSGDMVSLRTASEMVIEQNPEAAGDPNYRSAYQYLGVAHYSLGDLTKAQESFELAIQVNEDDVSSMMDLGNIYIFGMQLEKAVAVLESALQKKKGSKLDLHVLYKARSWMADWRDRDDTFDQIALTIERSVRDGVNLKLNAMEFVQLPATTLKKLVYHEQTSQFPSYSPPLHCQDAACLQLKSQQLRVGFVSSDFGIHPVVTLIRGMLDILSSPDHHVTVFCFPLTDTTSWWKQNISRTIDYMIPLQGKNPDTAAAIIRSYDIHVLIDLNGHTVHSGLSIFRYRPAPVQVSYLGYPFTIGMDCIDYFVSDTVASPAETASDIFTEKMLLLPPTYIVNDYMQIFGHAFEGERPKLATLMPKDADVFVLATFSNWQKIDPPVFQAWMEILMRVPSSVMWFLRYRGYEGAEKNLRAEADSYGINGSHRLVFTDLESWIDHIYAKRAADLILDTSHKNGHTTVIDALCAGVPVLSLEGSRMSNRAGSSVLHSLDLDILTVHSLKEYVEAAVRIATRPPLHRHLRRLVESRRESYPLFDTRKFSTNFESSLRSAWQVKKMSLLNESGSTIKHIFPSRRSRMLVPRQIPILSAKHADDAVDEYELFVQQAHSAGEKIQLHIGGRAATPDWWIVDIKGDDRVDFQMDMGNLYAFPSGSVSAVYASHVLEHCDYGVTRAVQATLHEWHRVLHPGGTLYVSVPDLLALTTLYANESTTAEERAFLMRVLYGGQTDAYDMHKVGFDENILAAYLAHAGFCNLTRVPDFGMFVDSSTMVIKGMPISLNIVAQPC